ncbi:hypothetical protein V6260_03135 [Pseudoalteromonas aliena]|uniref:hypothetical protein n=1 Tax=Pseudoalteromonas aliena TaxID=247523 RepID=UPI00311E39FA
MKTMKLYFFVYLLVLPLFINAQPSLTLLSRAYSEDQTERTADRHFYDLFEKVLNSKFEIDTQWTNHARMIKYLSSTQPVCTYNIIKTRQREKLFFFSKAPTTMFVQRRLYGFKETLKGLPDKVSVSKLLADNKTFGIVASTSYQELDNMFSLYQHQIASISSTNSFAQLGQLLAHRRIDMIIDYDYTVRTFLSAEQYEQLDSREIIEYPEFINGYFACSRTIAGKKAISLINSYMQTNDMYDFLKKIHFQTFGPDIAERMMRIYKSDYQISPDI